VSALGKEDWKAAGAWLRDLRLAAGLSQTEAAAAIGLKVSQQLSSIERGNNRMPVALMENVATTYRLHRTEVVRTLMKFYSPYEHYALFGEGAAPHASNDNAE
jgi:transcriptional regulator with XRE-family HTH domain